MTFSRFLPILGCIFLAVVSRFVPHPPNFTAINVVALLSAYSFKSIRTSFFIVFSAMFMSDWVIGFHSSLCVVYVTLGVIICLGRLFNLQTAVHRIPVALISSSLVFFVLTNLGVWLANPMYPKTLVGLSLCYLAALPFLANQIMGDFTYGLILMGCWVSYTTFYKTDKMYV